MIKLLTNADAHCLAELLSFCEKSCLGTKAIGPLLSYGTDFDFVTCYIQNDETGKIISVVSKYYSSVTAATADSISDACVSELAEFIKILGFRALVASRQVMEAFGADNVSFGYVYAYEKGGDCKARESDGDFRLAENENYREFFDALCQNNPGYLPGAYDEWYVDFSHRVRHGTAVFYGLYEPENSRCMSTAAGLTVTPNAVFMGAISTDPDARGKHYASTVIKHLCSQFPYNTIYLMCRPDKKSFYEKLGMYQAGEFGEYSSTLK